MTPLDTYLSALGLNAEQKALFNRLASQGDLTILQLSQLSSIPRTTVYLYIEELMAKGLIKEVEEGKKKKYRAISPRELLILLQNKKKEYQSLSEEFSQALPEFEGLYALPGRPRMMYYEGLKGIEQLFFSSLTAADKWYMVWTSKNQGMLHKQKVALYSMLDDHLIHTKELYREDHEGKLAKIERESLRHEIALIPLSYETTTDMIILDQKTISLVYEPELYALVIEDAHLAHTEKVKFHALFETYSRLS